MASDGDTDLQLEATRVDLTSLVSGPAPLPDGDWSLERGALVGRYFVLGRLGAGGMGEVYSAFDPELDRRVALKLVKFDAGEDASKARGRLLREAQALAKLSHPNVVAVHDAGTHGDRVFIAMEYVEGRTLRAWLREAEATRSSTHDEWRRTLALMMQAGAGLAAAHAQGMVHRDFKPANVMVSDDGRVRVLDFGLARRFGEVDPAEDTGPSGRHDQAPLDSHDSLNGSRPSLSIKLTQTGMVMGTPAYMAPEQFHSGYVDARTDQFSFCVVLYRSLFGIRPFAGDTFAELGRSVALGTIRDAPKTTGVPRAVQAVLRRGLSPGRDDRYPTMDALLADLERALGQGRRRKVGLGAGGIVVLVLGGGALMGRSTGSATPCQDFDAKLAGVWDDERRETMAAAFTATDLAYAQDARVAIERSLDEYTATWARLRAEVCEATQVRGDQSEALMDLRIGCLDDRLRHVSALTTVLTEEVDANVVQSAALGVGQLPPLPECATLERDESDLMRPDDEEQGAVVDEARELIAAARARVLAGKYADALERGKAALARAEQTGFTPVIAEAQHTVGQAHDRLMEPQPALAGYEAALYAAASSGHVRLEGLALIGMSSVLGMHMAASEEALRYAEHAEAIGHRLGDPPYYHGVIALYRGNALMAANQFDEALEHFRRAAELTRSIPEGDRIHLAALSNTAATLGQRGEYEAAAAAFEEALEAAEARLGAWHPMVGSMHNGLGVSYSRLDAPDRAMTHLERSIEIYEKALGPDHPELGRGHHNLGVALSERGDIEGAYRSYAKALDHKRRTLGPDHVSVAFSANNVGDALIRLGRAEEALPYIEDALRIWDASLGKDNPTRAFGLMSLAQAEAALGRPKDALRHIHQAIDLSAGDIPPSERAQTQFIAAQITLEAEGSPQEALALAEAARASYQAAERPYPDEIAEIDRWLAEHP